MNLTVTNPIFNSMCKISLNETSERFTPLCRALYIKEFAFAISLIKKGADINEPSIILVNSISKTCEFEITPLEISLFRLQKFKNKITILEMAQILSQKIIEISRSKNSAISKSEQLEAINFYESLPKEIKKYENLIKEVGNCIALLRENSIQSSIE